MGMSSGGDERGMMSEINVTPFVDVMLVLLVIFMITAPMMTTGMQVDLPRADAPALPTPDKQLVISLTSDGEYFLNDHPMTLEDLEPRLTAIAEKNPEQIVFVKADGEVPYQRVAALLAMCTQAGIARMGMVTQPGVGE